MLAVPRGLAGNRARAALAEGVLFVGAICCGILRCKFCDKVNAENFADFLTSAYEEYGPFVMFLDNASYHKSNGLKLFLEKMDGKNKVCYFPPYMPELNPTESQRRSFRRATGNLLHGSIEEMHQSIRKVSGREIPVVKTFDYLSCRTQRRQSGDHHSQGILSSYPQNDAVFCVLPALQIRWGRHAARTACPRVSGASSCNICLFLCELASNSPSTISVFYFLNR